MLGPLIQCKPAADSLLLPHPEEKLNEHGKTTNCGKSPAKTSSGRNPNLMLLKCLSNSSQLLQTGVTMKFYLTY